MIAPEWARIEQLESREAPSCGRCGVPYRLQGLGPNPDALTLRRNREMLATWAPRCLCWTLSPVAQEPGRVSRSQSSWGRAGRAFSGFCPKSAR